MRPEERDHAYHRDMPEATRSIIEFTGDRSIEEFVSTEKMPRGGQLIGKNTKSPRAFTV